MQTAEYNRSSPVADEFNERIRDFIILSIQLGNSGVDKTTGGTAMSLNQNKRIVVHCYFHLIVFIL